MWPARGGDSGRIVGLGLGADDYWRRPFTPRDRAARIGAILRRYEPRPPSPAGRLEVNGVALDPGTREVFTAGKKVDPTTLQVDILGMVMRPGGGGVSPDAPLGKFYKRKGAPVDRPIENDHSQ